MSKYQTRSTMLQHTVGPTMQVIEPDASLIKQLHAVLDMLPENQALIIDHIVAELIRFHNPNRQHLPELMP
jgi:hypothetical protein